MHKEIYKSSWANIRWCHIGTICLPSQKNRYCKESAEDVVIYALVSGEKYGPFLESLHIILKQQGLRERMRVTITPHMSRSKSAAWYLIISAWQRVSLRSLPAHDSAPSAIVCGKAAMNAEMAQEGINWIASEWLLPGDGGLELGDPGFSMLARCLKPCLPFESLPWPPSSLAWEDQELHPSV